ncbi:hypothetical protein INT43_006823 [Umbelopsis isabellina]|uniref:Uncharacterized protein n=1 Tax=Mortierella isabellina TaxID=91625 RepID=A0A8H7Q0R8_MORIS|nr:hypothetical protein INT43_006823 [Umbelopsis isabellina]
MLAAVTGHVAYRPRCHVKVRLVQRTLVAVFATAVQHAKAGSVISSELLRNNTGQVNYFIGACVQPALPDGLSLALDNSTGFVTLAGTPSVSSLPVNYTVIAKGGVNYIGTLNFTLSIA